MAPLPRDGLPLAELADLEGRIGVVEAGVFASIALLGVVASQTFFYFQANLKDKLIVKLLVPYCFIVETLHTVFICKYTYDVTVLNFGNVEYLTHSHWAFLYSIFLSTLVSTPVQIWFAIQVGRRSKKRNWILLGISIVASALRPCVTLASVILAGQNDSLLVYVKKYLSLTVVTVALGTFVDVLNSIALLHHLIVNGQSNERSRNIYDQFISWIVETGALTSVVSIATLILVALRGQQTAWFCPIIFAAKLYSVSFLASLNGRVSLSAASRHESARLQTFADSLRVYVTSETHILTDPPDGGGNRARSIPVHVGNTAGMDEALDQADQKIHQIHSI